jgi:aquaporin Z
LTGGLGSNGIASVGMVGAIVVEIILTFIFIFTILGVTSDESKGSVAGIVIGLTLAFVHIIGIPLTGTSVNPARSIGPAILSGNSDAVACLWIFIVAPLVGAALAAVIFKLLKTSKE